jgi:hypothetical protein
MVDGRYWGRGEKTRHALSDAEVQRYHQLALQGQRDAADLLDVEVRRDPAAEAGLTAHAHLFVIAQPVSSRGLEPPGGHRPLGVKADSASTALLGVKQRPWPAKRYAAGKAPGVATRSVERPSC